LDTKTYDIRNVIALSLIPAVGIFGTFWHIWNYGIVWQEPSCFLPSGLLLDLELQQVITASFHIEVLKPTLSLTGSW